jgi:hypothetical protein
MSTKSAEGQVDVLTLDVGGKWQCKSLLDQFGSFGAAEGTESGVLFVGCCAGEVGVEDDFVLQVISH